MFLKLNFNVLYIKISTILEYFMYHFICILKREIIVGEPEIKKMKKVAGK